MPITAFRGWNGHPVFPIGTKNTNLVENVEFLPPVKFQQIPFSDFTEGIEKLRRTKKQHISMLSTPIFHSIVCVRR